MALKRINKVGVCLISCLGVAFRVSKRDNGAYVRTERARVGLSSCPLLHPLSRVVGEYAFSHRSFQSLPYPAQLG